MIRLYRSLPERPGHPVGQMSGSGRYRIFPDMHGSISRDSNKDDGKSRISRTSFSSRIPGPVRPVCIFFYNRHFIIISTNTDQDRTAGCPPDKVKFMLDSKTLCLLRGIIGVIFGFLALMLPEVTLGTFYGFFWALIILGIVLFLFLAITGRGDDSMLWFGLSAVLLVIGLLSFMVSGFVAVILILIIAAVAIYNGFTDITFALEHPRTKYILIPGMIITGILLLGGLFYYFPGFEKYLFLSVTGTFALAFGLFSILLGFYNSDGPAAGD
jgi:hypothetical protein